MIIGRATVLGVSALLALGCATTTTGPAVGLDSIRPTRTLRTFRDVRDTQVVRQAWDLSCGSAALSTLLTHYLGDETSEASVIVWLLRRTDPVKIQSRGGFSLLDLKRFAESRGYKADGFAGLNLKELIDLGPAIVPVHVKGYDHFVVVRGMVGDRVVMADPAFGNLTRKADRFDEIWPSGIGFVVYRPGAESASARHVPLPDDLLVPDASFAYRRAAAGIVADPVRRGR